MQDSHVLFSPKIKLPIESGKLLNNLIKETPWRAEKVKVWGKSFDQPRLIAWYGDSNRPYKYSGIDLNPLPWTPELLLIKASVESYAHEEFNSVLLNYYRNERDGMGYHSDDEKELGPQPIIASLSLGEERTFVFKHKTSKTLKPLRVKLPSSSLLIMKGDTQTNWKHGVDKESQPCGPRVNLTFRRVSFKEG